MSMYLLILLGVVMLVAGGEGLIRGAVSIAQKLGLSPMLIGILLVGFGTSTPELVTSVQATINGAYGIAVGNVVGSNIANVLLILGVGALLTHTIFTHQTLKRDGAAMLIAALALVLTLLVVDTIGWIIGLIFVMMLVFYMIYCVRIESAEKKPTLHEKEADTIPTESALWKSLMFAFGGLALTIYGASFLVDGSVQLAQSLGVSDAIIGLTIVAVGTSLPELAATISASLKKQGDIAVGNIVGSNIYNILGILGITAIIHPITVNPSIIAVDMWIMLAAILAVLLLAWRHQAVSRLAGIAFLLSYGGYIGWLAYSA